MWHSCDRTDKVKSFYSRKVVCFPLVVGCSEQGRSYLYCSVSGDLGGHCFESDSAVLQVHVLSAILF